MKRKDLHVDQHVALKDGSEAYIVATGGWELIKYLRDGKFPEFNFPVTVFKNPYPEEEHEPGWTFDSYFVKGEGLPAVAVAVLRTEDEEDVWIPKVVKCDAFYGTWNRYRDMLEARRIAQEHRKEEEEKKEAYRTKAREIREYVEANVRMLRLDVEFDPITEYERGCMDWGVVDETKALIDLFDLKKLLEAYDPKEVNCALCGRSVHECVCFDAN